MEHLVTVWMHESVRVYLDPASDVKDANAVEKVLQDTLKGEHPWLSCLCWLCTPPHGGRAHAPHASREEKDGWRGCPKS